MSRHLNRRQRTLLLVFCSVIALLTVTVAGGLLSGQAMVTDFSRKNLAPCMAYPFGTDWMGRDMFARTLAGLSMSLRLGALTAGISAVAALVIGLFAATSGRVGDALTGWLIDLVMGIPHILLLILISLACGRGLTGVVAGIALTHWPSLARLLRAELLQLRESPFIRIAEKLGIGRLIAELPTDLCNAFLYEVFGTQLPDDLDEETQNTIQKFYENNLNISETARQLYLHRNTLVYRLERLEKLLGLDIRKFEDAMTFKLAMMVLAHVRKQQQQHTIA